MVKPWQLPGFDHFGGQSLNEKFVPSRGLLLLKNDIYTSLEEWLVDPLCLNFHAPGHYFTLFAARFRLQECISQKNYGKR
jgi:hypothetical protein